MNWEYRKETVIPEIRRDYEIRSSKIQRAR